MVIEFQCSHCSATIEADSEISGIKAECPACQEVVMVPAPGIEAGMDIGGFQIDKRLGVGGMGEVFAATQLAMDRKVALKILPPALTADEKTVERFLNEVRMAAKLEHPNIVTAFDAGKASGYHYLAMSYVNGEDLSERLKREKRVSENEALDIVDKIAHALGYAWDKHHLLHRDIKPANIMLTQEGEVKLMDMGIAKSLEEDSNLTMQGMLVGTPYYMSPEQATGSQDIDCRSDIYSLGATLYHLVTGVRPFNGPNAMAVIAKHMSETPIPPRSINSEISEMCETLISRMLCRDRDDRFESWKALRSFLAEMRSGATIELRGASDPTQFSGMQAAAAGDVSGDTGTQFHLGIDEEIGLKTGTTKTEEPPLPAATMMMPDAPVPVPQTEPVPAGTETEVYDYASDEKTTKWGVMGAAAVGVLMILVLVGVIALIIGRYNEGEVKQKIAEKETEIKEREIVGDITSSLAGHEELKMNREDLEEMLQLARDYAKNNPDNVSASEKKFRKVIKYAKELKLPKFEMEAETELEILLKQTEEEKGEKNRKAAKRIVRVLEIEAENLSNTYQYGPAANSLLSYDGDYAEETEDARKKLAAIIEAKGKEVEPFENFLRKAIRLFKADDKPALKRHLESAKEDSELHNNRELFKENIFPIVTIIGRQGRDRRPLREKGSNVPVTDVSKALVQYKGGHNARALESLNPVNDSLFKHVLIGEINGDILKGTWFSKSFSGPAYTGKVSSMTLSYNGSMVKVDIDGNGLTAGEGHVLGTWLHFKLKGREKFWEISSINQTTLAIQPLQGVTARMQKKK